MRRGVAHTCVANRIPACQDPFDVPFLLLAAAGRAHALVAGDADLLALASQVRYSILKPGAFLEPLPVS